MQCDVIYVNGGTDEGVNQWMDRGTGERRERESGRQMMGKRSPCDTLVCNVTHKQTKAKILLTHQVKNPNDFENCATELKQNPYHQWHRSTTPTEV